MCRTVEEGGSGGGGGGRRKRFKRMEEGRGGVVDPLAVDLSDDEAHLSKMTDFIPVQRCFSARALLNSCIPRAAAAAVDAAATNASNGACIYTHTHTHALRHAHTHIHATTDNHDHTHVSVNSGDDQSGRGDCQAVHTH